MFKVFTTPLNPTNLNVGCAGQTCQIHSGTTLQQDLKDLLLTSWCLHNVRVVDLILSMIGVYETVAYFEFIMLMMSQAWMCFHVSAHSI